MQSLDTLALVKGTFFCVSVLLDLSPKNNKTNNNKVKCKLTLRVSKNSFVSNVKQYIYQPSSPFPQSVHLPASVGVHQAGIGVYPAGSPDGAQRKVGKWIGRILLILILLKFATFTDIVRHCQLNVT